MYIDVRGEDMREAGLLDPPPLPLPLVLLVVVVGLAANKKKISDEGETVKGEENS